MFMGLQKEPGTSKHQRFQFKVRIKYQVEKYISTKNNNFRNLFHELVCNLNCRLLLDSFFCIVFLFAFFVLFQSVL